MATNWKSAVEKSLAEAHVLPDGWDSREEIAEQLGCSDERVRLVMAPLIKDRKAEVKVFTVWDRELKRLSKVTAYREIKAAPATQAGKK